MTSEPFADSPRRYLNRLAAEWLSGHWLILFLPVLTVLVWTVFDLRALYVLLIVIFLLYPMGLTLVWFNFALSPRSLRAIAPKRMTLTDTGINITYSPRDIESDPRPAFPDEFISWESVKSVHRSAKFVTLVIGPRLDDRITVPLDAFDDKSLLTLHSTIDRRFGYDEL